MDSIFVVLLLLGYFAVMGMRWQQIQPSSDENTAQTSQLKDFWED